jgi:TolB-like protein/Flp pilus assembly protein TadD
MPAGAVFLSYASEDGAAAERIATALRAAGIEVWFDKSELRGGDAWDRQIRRQIRDCVLFVPIISAHTQGRPEGYFRLEWNLADQRTHLMGRSRAFLVPVCPDATLEKEADVPDSFVAVQWTRLPGGETPPAFVDRVRRLLSGEAPTAIRVPGGAGAIEYTSRPRWTKRTLLAAIAVVILGTVVYLGINKLWITKPAVSAVFAPPPHSIAVLPFVNMSGDKEQEYFSDGLTEEILNSLARINELQVSARTSSFSFKGEKADLRTIARKLNVGAILEGSVRRSGDTIRITAQLDNSITGFHLWSQTYDRDLGDVLKLQTEIATAVAGALRVTLLGDVAAKVELGGTRNPLAFDAYLRGAKAYSSRGDTKDLPAAIAAYTEAIRLDPHYALAFAARSIARSAVAAEAVTAAAMREGYEQAHADAQQALALAPDLAQAHLASAAVAENGTLDFTQASEAYDRALALAPGDAQILRNSGLFAAWMGHFDAGVAATRRAVVLDPLARQSRSALADALYVVRRYQEALAALAEVISLEPEYKHTYVQRGLVYYVLGDLQSARASCETKPDYWGSQWCLAVTYDRLGRHADAEAALAKLRGLKGDAAAYQYATIYAQWGNRPQALEWLETALRLRDPGLELLKTDPLMDPLRREPRFQGIERELKFPDLHRKIVFDREPLARVAAEFNRHAAKPIEITTPELRNLEISGVFTDDSEEFIAFLRSLEGVRVDVSATRVTVSKK